MSSHRNLGYTLWAVEGVKCKYPNLSNLLDPHFVLILHPN